MNAQHTIWSNCRRLLAWVLLILWVGIALESTEAGTNVESEWKSQQEAPEDGSDKEEIDWDEALAWGSTSDAQDHQVRARQCALNERWQELLRDTRLLDPPDGTMAC